MRKWNFPASGDQIVRTAYSIPVGVKYFICKRGGTPSAARPGGRLPLPLPEALEMRIMKFPSLPGCKNISLGCHELPRPLSFLKNISSQASFLVLIFSKKAGFSLTKVGKVMMPFHTKTYISFMLNQEEYFSNSVRHAEGGTVVPVRSTDQSVARSSPTQRKYFVCNYCLAGARPLFQFIFKYL